MWILLACCLTVEYVAFCRYDMSVQYQMTFSTTQFHVLFSEHRKYFTHIKHAMTSWPCKWINFFCSCMYVFITNVVSLSCRGNVVTMECVEKIIKKDMIDPTNSKKMTDKDIIPLQRVCNGILNTHIYNIIKPLSPDSFCCIHSSLSSFVGTDIVTTISHEWLEQSRWNLQGIFTSPSWQPV